MKAVRIHAYGNADELRYEDAPEPVIAPDDVLVRVVAASVNPVDWKIREGYLKQMIAWQFPPGTISHDEAATLPLAGVISLEEVVRVTRA
jgi:NADPH:quinone reductase-like Zn-dependent oxidoreductase